MTISVQSGTTRAPGAPFNRVSQNINQAKLDRIARSALQQVPKPVIDLEKKIQVIS